MRKKINSVPLSKRLDLFAGFLKTKITKIGFIDLAVSLVFNRILFEVELYLEETDPFTNYFLLFVVINNVMLWAYHNFWSRFEVTADYYQKEFFNEYITNPDLTEEAANNKISEFQASEIDNWFFSSLPIVIVHCALLPINSQFTSIFKCHFYSLFSFLWAGSRYIKKSRNTILRPKENVKKIALGLNKAVKRGTISFTNKQMNLMQFSLKKSYNSLSLINGPKLQLSSELSLR
ncbi:MAG: hypothetical protein JSR33_12030, partial [Proteobacteria bacterium]|nr:hypothetical protein [Pseudomonadota bacterium]